MDLRTLYQLKAPAFSRIFGVLFLLILGFTDSYGQSIFSNPITGTNPNTANPYTAGQLVNPNITVSGIGRGSGINGSNTNNRYNATGWNIGSLGATQYFEFVLTPSVGYAINFTSFEYTGQASGTGPTSFAFRSSVDSFAGNIGTATVSGTTISLSGAAFQNITQAIRFRIYAWGASGGSGTFSINDFTFNGQVVAACTQPVITSFLPASAPVNTLVKINGNGFLNGSGTTSVKFNGVPATSFTVISNTLIEAVIPVGATTGAVTITTNNCTGTSAASYTILSSNCSTLYADLFISELYDAQVGDGGVIELYNGTGATINMTQYSILRYGNIGDATPSYTIPLTGTLASGSVYLIRIGNDAPVCTFTPNMTYNTGFNANDAFELVKNTTVIDVVNAPNNAGYSVIRLNTVPAPNSTFVDSEWNTSSSESCADIGLQNYNNSTTTVIAPQPVNAIICENQTASFTVGVSNPAGVTYQWKILNSSGNWVNVTNSATYSGATTATLTVNNVPISFNGNQYYCFVNISGCQESSHAAMLTVKTKPVTAGIYFN
ncbi:lamin tail domain-containing protein [Flavobacterium sp. UBA4197]|uniref:lamin tail domain-containing protein n=1 Tax=Flavobacterium sp. UBA4197 TaxID=1946546 RepID=UPI00257B2B9E|nr:lamin tail domain-containing protein [Flavobacterium sp. UBA4197]